jgi:hypothetical protein
MREKIKVVIIPYDALPCACREFTINGIDADISDFGSGEDLDPGNADEYACANHQFTPQMPTDEVLEKYGINLKEYAEICDELKSALAVGECGWCI